MTVILTHVASGTGTASGLGGTFENIENFTGSANSDMLIAPDSDDTFNITGSDAGNIDNNFSFNQVENLDAGDGDDTLDFTTFTGPVTINLETETADGLGGEFNNFENFTGSADPDDTLIGPDGGAIFNITGLNSGDVDGTYFFTDVENLTGGDGDDSFVFTDPGQLSGDIDGGDGADELRFNALTSQVTVDLNGPSDSDGFSGAVPSRVNTFIHINTVVGSATVTTDALSGADRQATWLLGTNYQYTDILTTNTLTFSNFDDLTGGSDNDTFEFGNGVTFEGSVDGGAGDDDLDYTACTTQVDVTLNDLGSADGFAGQGTGITGTFDNIDLIDISTGGTNSDTLTGADRAATWELDGSDRYIDDSQPDHDLALTGFDELNGGSLADTFDISADRSYDLYGGDGSDDFNLIGNATLTGLLDGQNGAEDSLDFSQYASAPDVTIIDVDATGYRGTQAAITDGFSGIDHLVGTVNAGVDGAILRGYNWDSAEPVWYPSLWNLAGANSTYMLTSAVNSLRFESFDLLFGSNDIDRFNLLVDTQAILFGGPGDDLFSIQGGAKLIGSLDGGGGSNTLDYHLYDLGDGSGVLVDLPNNKATHIVKLSGDPGSVAGIHNIVGSAYDDHLIGHTGENMITGGEGDDLLEGGDADDSYIFAGDAFGHDTIVEADTPVSGANDTLDFSAAISSLDFNLPAFLVTDGTNQVDYGANIIEHFIGGLNTDNFIFTGAYTLPQDTNGQVIGTLDGGNNLDTLDYAAYGSSVSVNLMAGTATATDGVSAIENVTASRFDDVLIGDNGPNVLIGNRGDDQLTGNGGADTLQGGLGDDTYYFAGDSWGADTLTDTGGSDSLHFRAATTDLNFHINLIDLSIEDGTNQLAVTANDIENLLGGRGDDAFIFAENAVLAGGGLGTYVDGGPAGNPGLNTLDYSAYTTDVFVSLAARYATGVNNGVPVGIDRIDNVVGGTFANEIWGDNGDNILESGSTNDTLFGMGGNDTYVFYDDWGTDVVDESAANFGGGTDTLDFSHVTGAGSGALTFTFDGSTISVTDTLTGSIVTTFNYIENFIGGPTDDTFTFQNGAVINGFVDGQGGYNTIDYSAYGSARHITLTDVGSLTGVIPDAGFKGHEISLGSVGYFDNIDEIVGTPFTDSLTGRDAQATFDLAAGEYRSVNTLDFSAIEDLNGGVDVDTFLVLVDHTGDLSGGDGDDRFAFSAAAVLTGGADGQAGFDQLDFSAYTARDVEITGMGTIDGLRGFDSAVLANRAITGGFDNIDDLLGSATGADSLTGADQAASFVFDADHRYNLNGQFATFAGFETLIGGTQVDSFAFDGTGSFVGTLDGGAGDDRLDYSGYANPVTVDLHNDTATGLTGTFTSIENFTGSVGSDTLIGPDASATFNITAQNTGNVGAAFDFTSVENLVGGSATDDNLSFAVYPSAIDFDLDTVSAAGFDSFGGFEIVTGSAFDDTITARTSGSNFQVTGAGTVLVDGLNFVSFETIQGCGGVDTLDYSLHPGPVTFDLETNSSTGLASFAGIENLVGSTHPAGDTIIGPDAGATFNVTAGDAGNVAGYTFDSVEHLTGRSGNDIFAFQGAASLSGDLAGGPGIDTLDYSAYAAAVSVNLLAQVSDHIAGNVTGIENLIGSAFDDDLAGDDDANRINAFGGSDKISGNAGDDTFLFPAGSSFRDALQGGAGSDTADFSAYAAPIAVVLTATGALDGFDGLINGNPFSDLDEIIASGQAGDSLTGMDATADWFVNNDRYTSSGRTLTFFAFEDLIGGNADDTLDYGAQAGPITITLLDLGTDDGFQGTASSVAGTFDSMDGVIGSASADDELVGRAVGNTFHITDDNGGDVDGLFDFASIENIAGGPGVDVYEISQGVSFNGFLDGQANDDQLGFAGHNNAVNLSLDSQGLIDGFSGTGTGFATGSSFTNIDTITGGNALSDRIDAPLDAATTFNVSADNAGDVDGILTFDSFEHLTGSNLDDSFIFTGNASLARSIDGGLGQDRLDYSGYNSGVSVNLDNTTILTLNRRSASMVSGGASDRVTNIENLIGSDYADVLIANSLANQISGRSGDDTLAGRAGDDTYLFDDDYGDDSVIEEAGAGLDRLDFSLVSNELLFSLSDLGQNRCLCHQPCHASGHEPGDPGRRKRR